MPRFVETDSGWVNLDHVAKVVELLDEKKTRKAAFYSQTGEALGSTRFGFAPQMLGTIIPAPEGYQLVRYWVEEREVGCFFEPIIAFSADQDALWPITLLDALNEEDEGWAIQRPDGCVTTIQYQETFSNIDVFKAHLRNRSKSPAGT